MHFNAATMSGSVSSNCCTSANLRASSNVLGERKKLVQASLHGLNAPRRHAANREAAPFAPVAVIGTRVLVAGFLTLRWIPEEQNFSASFAGLSGLYSLRNNFAPVSAPKDVRCSKRAQKLQSRI